MELQEGRKEFLAWAGDNKDLLTKFLEFRKKVSGNEANMDWWVANKSPKDLEDFMNNYKSKGEVRRQEMAGADKIYDKDGWVCIHCKTYDAMKHYGKGTKWCIAGNYPGHENRGQYYFDNYLESNYTGYYVVINNNIKQEADGRGFLNNKWCVCPKQSGGRDIWNAPDNTVEFIDDAPYIPGLPQLSPFRIEDGVLVKATIGIVSEVRIPSAVKKIGPKAFIDSRIDSVSFLDSSVESIGRAAFAGSGISQIRLPSSVKEIGEACFLGCEYLTLVDLGVITNIPSRAFAYCDALYNVYANKISSLDESAFDGISKHRPDPLRIYVNGSDGNKAIIDFANKAGFIDVIDRSTGELYVDTSK